jgi:predicted CopG family antitoxin
MATVEMTTISVSEELADELHEMKDRGDSYEDVIWELIDDSEGEEASDR